MKEKSLSDLKILVAEDNRINQILAEKQLADWGVNYQIVNNGSEAIAFADRERYDVILMDLQMPETDGFEAARHIKDCDGGKNSETPIYALTADSFPETEKEVLSCGMSGIIIKPVDSEELLKLLSQHII